MDNKMVLFYFTVLALVAVGSSSPLDLGNTASELLNPVTNAASGLLNPIKNVAPLPSLVRNARYYPHYGSHYPHYGHSPYYGHGGGISHSNAHASASAGSGSGGYYRK